MIPAEGAPAPPAAGRNPAGRNSAGGGSAGQLPGRDSASALAGRARAGRDSASGNLAGSDVAGLLFVAEMYGVQLDQLAAVLDVSEQRARAIAARWRSRGHAESARLGPGPPWVWLTRAGLASCGLPYAQAPPALSRLAHIRAVIAVRLALESAPGYRAAGAYWRSERRLRGRQGGRASICRTARCTGQTARRCRALVNAGRSRPS